MQSAVSNIDENSEWYSLRYFQDDELAAEQIAGKLYTLDRLT